MLIKRKIYINTVENLRRNNEHGNIIIDIKYGIEATTAKSLYIQNYSFFI
jgi:hypothetical protein